MFTLRLQFKAVPFKQVDLENAGDPNNVNWYKVNQETGEDTKIEATDLVKINKAKGKQ